LEKVYVCHGGNKVGKMATEAIVDRKGRILIPKEIREKIGLQAGRKVRIKVDKEKVIVTPLISPEEFIEEMEGCIKEGTPTIDPLKLKEMWENKEK
jgi:AbrB family looped-hinge helix DNA binding protein